MELESWEDYPLDSNVTNVINNHQVQQGIFPLEILCHIIDMGDNETFYQIYRLNRSIYHCIKHKIPYYHTRMKPVMYNLAYQKYEWISHNGIQITSNNKHIVYSMYNRRVEIYVNGRIITFQSLIDEFKNPFIWDHLYRYCIIIFRDSNHSISYDICKSIFKRLVQITENYYGYPIFACEYRIMKKYYLFKHIGKPSKSYDKSTFYIRTGETNIIYIKPPYIPTSTLKKL